MLTNINEIKKYLNQRFIERTDIINGILTAIIAGANCLLLGGAGVAKSALVNEAASLIGNTHYFQWLLTRYTVPEEIFGALSLKELEQGIYKRNVSGKLPEATVAFLDEIFKANSAILNTLLTIINEKVFHNNGTPMLVPLVSLFGASNEYPEENEGLEPLYDRFTIRYWVNDVTDTGFEKILATVANPVTLQKPSIPLKEIMELQEAAKRIRIEQDVIDTLQKIRIELRDLGIEPSTRRFVQSLNLIRSSALLDGATTAANVSHLNILKDVLWDRSEQVKDVAAIVRKYCVDSFQQVLEEHLQMAEEQHKIAVNDGSADAGMEAIKKIKKMKEDMDELKRQNPSKANLIEPAQAKLNDYLKEIYSKCMGMTI